MELKIKKVIKKVGTDSHQLLTLLIEIQRSLRFIPVESYKLISQELRLAPNEVEGVASFYHFLSKEHRGHYTIYCNTSSTAEIAGCSEVIKTFEQELGIKVGQTTKNHRIGLFTTSCIGMCDQEPSILINDEVLTKMTPEKVRALCKHLKKSIPLTEFKKNLGDSNNSLKLIKSQVKNNIRVRGPLFFSNSYKTGESLALAIKQNPLTLIDEMVKSKLRGRGGAGFPTGKKWLLCSQEKSESRYVICNADEGEPGTFKDRVLLTERSEMIFEGMSIAGYAIGSSKGILYLRSEYYYLKKFLENQIKTMKRKKLLGDSILSSDFNFNIEIKMGAGGLYLRRGVCLNRIC